MEEIKVLADKTNILKKCHKIKGFVSCQEITDGVWSVFFDGSETEYRTNTGSEDY